MAIGGKHPVMKLPLKTLIPGFSAAASIILILGAALFSLCYFAISSGDLTLYFDDYLWHIFIITIWQAALSTLLSIICALLMAKALSMTRFIGKRVVLRCMPITFILPTVVVITGLFAVYGQQGLIALTVQQLGLRYSPSIYGLTGILLAHLFLNFPYACRLFYQTLVSVPLEQKQLAIQLNFSHITYFKLVEWPYLRRQLMPMAALIFLLCFSSFAIVLALGGGPKYTTIEVAIYQAIRDFELVQAVGLSLIQLLFCCGFIAMSRKFGQLNRLGQGGSSHNMILPLSFGLSLICYCVIILGCLFIFTPIISLIVEGIRYFDFSLFNKNFWLATGYSTIIALGSGIVTLGLACLLLWTNSRLLNVNQTKWSHRLMLIGTLILAIPSMVLASGFFLLFYDYSDNTVFLCLLIITCNSLTALPFVLKNLEYPMFDVLRRYDKLNQLLNLNGIWHFYWIEYKALRRLIVMTFAFACLLSLGDFGIIALFGGQSFNTLPYYLFEQLSHYRYHDASVTALVLLLLSFILLMVMDNDRT